jgi:hypothetical protein
MEPKCRMSRRGFVQATTLLAAGSQFPAHASPSRPAVPATATAGPAEPGCLEQNSDRPHLQPPSRSVPATKKLAVVTTAYYYLSHAYHICGRFLNGYLREGRFHFPDFAIAGMYVEQQKDADLSRELSAKHGFQMYPDIAGALTLGGIKLAVDGVLLIGEHGDYPYNDKGQKLYPRFEMFQQIVEVFRRTGKSVPVFCDKHLSTDRRRAREMVETARKLGFPLMAGSSLPITWRRPELELPRGVAIREALVASRGELEIFGIHALEALQCMVERRTSAVQGVRSVTCLEGDAVWQAGDEGRWSWDLLEHAVRRSPSRNVGDIRENCRHFRPATGNLKYGLSPVAFLLEYHDGLRATVLILSGHVDDTTFAARTDLQDAPVSTLFYLPPPPGAAFLEAITVKIEQFLESGRPPYPVERTLLTGSVLEAALDSRARGHVPVAIADGDIRYEPPADSGFLRGDY